MSDQISSLRKLIEALYIKTIAKNVSWEYFEAIDVCETGLGKGYVQTAGETDEDGDYYPVVKILNSEKQVIDTIHAGIFQDAKPVNTGQANYWELIRDLKGAAERSAKGADEVIASILSELGTDDISLEKPLDDDGI